MSDLAGSEEAQREYDVTLTQMDKLDSADCIVLAVAHTEYVQAGWEFARQLLSGGEGVVFDIRGGLPRERTLKQSACGDSDGAIEVIANLHVARDAL